MKKESPLCIQLQHLHDCKKNGGIHNDFQICVFFLPIMSVMHNLHRKENVWSWLFFSFCLFSFSSRSAGTAECWDKSPTLSLVRRAQYGGWRGTQGSTTWGLSWVFLAAIKKKTSLISFLFCKGGAWRAMVWNTQCSGGNHSLSHGDTCPHPGLWQ